VPRLACGIEDSSIARVFAFTTSPGFTARSIVEYPKNGMTMRRR
jgi:hypothetical protein